MSELRVLDVPAWPPVNAVVLAAMKRLYDAAACADADPATFDSSDPDSSDAQAALGYCYLCPVLSECHLVLSPHKTAYDGVAAGQVWRNGIPRTRSNAPALF